MIRHCGCLPGTERLLGLGGFQFQNWDELVTLMMSLNPLAMEETYRMVHVLLVIIS